MWLTISFWVDFFLDCVGACACLKQPSTCSFILISWNVAWAFWGHDLVLTGKGLVRKITKIKYLTGFVHPKLTNQKVHTWIEKSIDGSRVLYYLGYCEPYSRKIDVPYQQTQEGNKKEKNKTNFERTSENQWGRWQFWIPANWATPTLTFPALSASAPLNVKLLCFMWRYEGGNSSCASFTKKFTQHP